MLDLIVVNSWIHFSPSYWSIVSSGHAGLEKIVVLLFGGVAIHARPNYRSYSSIEVIGTLFNDLIGTDISFIHFFTLIQSKRIVKDVWFSRILWLKGAFFATNIRVLRRTIFDVLVFIFTSRNSDIHCLVVLQCSFLLIIIPELRVLFRFNVLGWGISDERRVDIRTVDLNIENVIRVRIETVCMFLVKHSLFLNCVTVSLTFVNEIPRLSIQNLLAIG